MNEDSGTASSQSGNPPTLRSRIGAGVVGAAFAFLAGALILAQRSEDPDSAQQIAAGKAVYERTCTVCHGGKLEGQPNWREKLPTGRMPAPPHDASGHTWHHPDSVLFGITKHGLVPGRYAPPGHQSDMPAFAGVLTDGEIRAVLAYIKSSWPSDIRKAQDKITRERDRS